MTTDNFPDPAGVINYQVGNSSAQLYATSNGVNNSDIPTRSWTPGTSSVGTEQDALPPTALPANFASQTEWAPSVHFIPTGNGSSGNYVMWFSPAIANGYPNAGTHCLAWAEAQTMSGPFLWGASYCDFNPVANLIDPTFFRSIDGSYWLAWSMQVPNGNGTYQSYIDAQQLNSTATAFTLVFGDWIQIAQETDFANVACIYVNNGCEINGAQYGVGSNPVVENPQLVIDPSPSTATYNGTSTTYYVDAYVSYGTWWQGDQYHTLEFACTNFTYSTVSSPCVGNTGSDITGVIEANGDTAGIDNPAGLSILDGTGSSTPYAIFAAATSGNAQPRFAYYEPTYVYHRTGQCGVATCS